MNYALEREGVGDAVVFVVGRCWDWKIRLFIEMYFQEIDSDWKVTL